MKNNRAFVLDPEKADEFLKQRNGGAKKALERFNTYNNRKIINGSRFTIGEKCVTTFPVDQHFNWFQKSMWKLCFGVKVEDYSEDR